GAAVAVGLAPREPVKSCAKTGEPAAMASMATTDAIAIGNFRMFLTSMSGDGPGVGAICDENAMEAVNDPSRSRHAVRSLFASGFVLEKQGLSPAGHIGS
ncbi:MAG: hypothetical protein J0H17_10070, partial [Rhizobiales bacterium]|nr:hypothetical protein [Hyphomicrobiales bacterium]